MDLLVGAYQADSSGGILDFFHAAFESTGSTFEHYLLGLCAIDTRDPENIEAILGSQFNEFSLGDRPDNFRPLLGHGIFTRDGPAWKASRDLIRPQFMQTRNKSFPLMQQGIEKFLSKVQKECQGTDTIDLQPLFFRLTLETTMMVLCGKPLEELQSPELGGEEAFAQAFSYAQHRLHQRARVGPFYWLIAGREFRRSCELVHNSVDRIVASALHEQTLKTDPKGSDRYIFLDSLMSSTQDPTVLRDQLINILLAGRDTTACLLSWVFKSLARHQDIQADLRAECLNLESFRTGSFPTAAEVKGMKLLNNVLSETLRLYPSVPLNSRAALKMTTLPVGGGPDGCSPIVLRKGEAVGYSLHSMHRRKDIYGNDAVDFRPSRWDDEEHTKSLGWAYLPFNGGPRACPGREFALLEAGYTVVRMLQAFNVIEELPDEPEQHAHTLTLVLAPKNGCRVRLR